MFRFWKIVGSKVADKKLSFDGASCDTGSGVASFRLVKAISFKDLSHKNTSGASVEDSRHYLLGTRVFYVHCGSSMQRLDSHCRRHLSLTFPTSVCHTIYRKNTILQVNNCFHIVFDYV